MPAHVNKQNAAQLGDDNGVGLTGIPESTTISSRRRAARSPHPACEDDPRSDAAASLCFAKRLDQLERRRRVWPTGLARGELAQHLA